MDLESMQVAMVGTESTFGHNQEETLAPHQVLVPIFIIYEHVMSPPIQHEATKRLMMGAHNTLMLRVLIQDQLRYSEIVIHGNLEMIKKEISRV